MSGLQCLINNSYHICQDCYVIITNSVEIPDSRISSTDAKCSANISLLKIPNNGNPFLSAPSGRLDVNLLH